MKPTPLAIALAVCLLAPTVTRAEAPNRTYQVSFPTSLTLVDPSGNYSANEALQDISVSGCTLVVDLAGKITGTCSGIGSGIYLGAPITCTGSISGNSTTPRMSLTGVGRSSSTAQGMRVSQTITWTFSGTYSPASGQFIGSTKGKACVTVEREKQCENSSEPGSFKPEHAPVSPGTVVTVTTNAKNKTTGTATISSDGRNFPNWKVTGKYTARTDASQLTLSAPDRSGAKLAFTGQATPSGTIQNTTKGSSKLLGQSLKW